MPYVSSRLIPPGSRALLQGSTVLSRSLRENGPLHPVEVGGRGRAAWARATAVSVVGAAGRTRGPAAAEASGGCERPAGGTKRDTSQLSRVGRSWPLQLFLCSPLLDVRHFDIDS